MMSHLDRAGHLILAPTSWGNKLSASTRLVALTIMLWRDEHERLSGGRKSMDLDFIADRTGLSHASLEDALARLEQYQLVRKHADGWRVTFDAFVKTARTQWSGRERVRTLH